MTETHPDLDGLLEFALGLARSAGEITLRYFHKAAAERKADGSFVTVADREAEAFVRAQIAERFPDDGVLGEEYGESTGCSGRRWIIDPIDGTFSYVHGVPFYGVLIGLEIASIPAAGVINMPALGEMAFAARGLGCYWNDVSVRVSEVKSVDEALLLATDFEACARFGFRDAVDELKTLAAGCRTWGDCYGHLLVATGRADVMLDPVMNVWDCAALSPIIEEAGGTFTDWKGEKTIYGGNAISTNGLLFGTVMETISKHG